MAAAAPAAVETAPIPAAGAEPTHTHFIKKIKFALEPIVLSPACYALRAPYNVWILPHTKIKISTEVLVSLPISSIGIITPCHDWKLDEHVDAVTTIIDSRRWTCMEVVVWNHTIRPLKIKRGQTIAMLSVVGRYVQGPWPCGTLQH
jgi:hypothetical protein